MTKCSTCEQTDRRHYACNRSGDLGNLPVGMAYVPWQQFDTVYELDKAFEVGTIFPELNQPFCGERGVMVR